MAPRIGVYPQEDVVVVGLDPDRAVQIPTLEVGVEDYDLLFAHADRRVHPLESPVVYGVFILVVPLEDILLNPSSYCEGRVLRDLGVVEDVLRERRITIELVIRDTLSSHRRKSSVQGDCIGPPRPQVHNSLFVVAVKLC